LNHYKDIYLCVEKFENKINSLSNNIAINSIESYDSFDYMTNELNFLGRQLNKIKGIKNCFPIIYSEIISFNNIFISQMLEYSANLKDKIEITEKEINADSSISIMYLEAYKKQYKELNELKFYKYHYLEYIKQFKKYLQDLYNISINAFIPTEQTISSKKPTQIYNGENLELPPVKFYFTSNYEKISSIKIIKYDYEITSLQDIIYVTLYHIILNKRALLQCANCGDYFLPKKRNNEMYCGKYIKQDAGGNNLYCRDIGKHKKYMDSKSDTLVFYSRLVDRISAKIKREPNNNNLQNLLIELKSNHDIILKKYSNRDTRLRKLHNYLVEFDKQYQKEYPSRKKYLSKEWWEYTD
jgi:hypothetical protein